MQSTVMLMFVAALFGAGMAIAQSDFTTLADNKRSRYMSKLDEHFRAADTDGDGALSREESRNGNMKPVFEHFDRLDGNNDGRVTRDELRSLIRSRISS